VSNFGAYCIGHLPPRYEIPFQYTMLSPQSLGMSNQLVISDNRFDNSVDGSSLAEYSQLFALSEMIQSGEIANEYLYLFQYRKFISPIFNGGLASTATWLRILTDSECTIHFPTEHGLEQLQRRVIVGSYLQLGESLASSYSKVHVIDDFVTFTASMISTGLFTELDIQQFVTQNGMIPSPALTYIESGLFVKIMTILKTVWDHFSMNYAIPREGYQRRVSGYLLERLHSFLLCKWLMDGSEPDVGIWERYVVLE